MGFPGILMKWVFRNHSVWVKGLPKILLGSYYKYSFKNTTTLCWFISPFESPKEWFEAGRMFGRCWLLFTKEGAYIHPFGSLITNEKAFNKIKETLKIAATEKALWMIFRAGYSKKPTRSYRLSVDELIIK
jgi:hypothetical protein